MQQDAVVALEARRLGPAVTMVMDHGRLAIADRTVLTVAGLLLFAAIIAEMALMFVPTTAADDLPLAHPLPKLVFFLLAQTAIVGRVSFDVTINGSHELPHGHSPYFLRREAERRTVAVDRGKSDFSIGETVKLLSV